MLKIYEQDLLKGKNINHIIHVVNEQIAEANRLLLKYNVDHVGALAGQLYYTNTLENEVDAWRKAVDAMFTEIFDGQHSSVMFDFDNEKGDERYSKFSGLLDVIRKRQNVLATFRDDLEKMEKEINQ